MANVYDLTPADSRKSFYGKAKVIFCDGARYLLSYDTIMGSIDAQGKWHKYSDYYSATTNRHVIAFFGDNKRFWALPLEQKPNISVTL